MEPTGNRLVSMDEADRLDVEASIDFVVSQHDDARHVRLKHLPSLGADIG